MEPLLASASLRHAITLRDNKALKRKSRVLVDRIRDVTKTSREIIAISEQAIAHSAALVSNHGEPILAQDGN
jgi:hypothetical protein